jgi:putative Ca2+/H+ antiporter (TMEM165/GDT1 family)
MFARRYSRHNSVLLSELIMVNIPLALVGAVICLWLSGQPLSVAAIVGFVTMAVIPVRTDTEKQEIELKPAGDKLEATGSVKVGPDTKAVAVVTVNGKAATAHFTLK